MNTKTQWPEVNNTYTFNPSNEILNPDQKLALRELVKDIDIFAGFSNQLLPMLALSDKEEVFAVSFDYTPGLLLQMLLVAFYDKYHSIFFFNRIRQLREEDIETDSDYIAFREFGIEFFKRYFDSAESPLLMQIMQNLDELLKNFINTTSMWYQALRNTDQYDYILNPEKRNKVMKAINNRRITFLPVDLRSDYQFIEDYIRQIGRDLSVCFYGSNTLEYIETNLGEETPQQWLDRMWRENVNLRTAVVTSFGGKIIEVRLEDPQLAFGDDSYFVFQAKRK